MLEPDPRQVRGPRDCLFTAELAGALLPPPLAVVGCYGPAGSSSLELYTDPGGIAATYAAPEDANGDDGDSVQFSTKQSGALCPCQPELVAAAECCAPDGLLQQLVESHVPLRCTAELVLSVSVGGGSTNTSEPAFKQLEEQLCGDGTVLVALAPQAEGEAAAAAPVLPGDASFKELGASWARPAVLRPLQRAAGGAAAAPRIAWQPGQQEHRHSSLCLDVLCYVPAGMPASEAVASIVRPAVRRQLAAMQADVEEAVAAGALLHIPTLPPQRALHFLPPGMVHHITVVRLRSGCDVGESLTSPPAQVCGQQAPTGLADARFCTARPPPSGLAGRELAVHC